jgi:hypothetical protein
VLERVCFATPNSTDFIQKPWFEMFERLWRPAQWRLLMPSTLPVGEARNEVLRRAVADKEEWVAFMDWDQILPEGWLQRLWGLATGNDGQAVVAMAGSLYFERGEPHYPVAGHLNPDGTSYRVLTEFETPDWGMKVDVIGMGAALVHVPSIAHLAEKPLFGYEWGGFRFGTEDIRAFNVLKEEGLEVVLDTKFPVGHLGQRVVGRQEWEIEKAKLLKEAGYADLRP